MRLNKKRKVEKSESSDHQSEPVPAECYSEEPQAEENPLVLQIGTYEVDKNTSKKNSLVFMSQVTALDREEHLVIITFLKCKGASFIRPELDPQPRGYGHHSEDII